MRASDIIRTPAVTISSAATVERAAKMLNDSGFRALPVIDRAGHLVGIVSEADLIRNQFGAPESPLGGGAGAAGERPARTVAEIMTADPFTVPQDVGLDSVAGILADRRYTIPVVDGDRVVGVITRRDVMTVLAAPAGTRQSAMRISETGRHTGRPNLPAVNGE